MESHPCKRPRLEQEEERKESPPAPHTDSTRSEKRPRVDETKSSLIPPPLSIAQRLFDNGIHCITAFLPLREALPSFFSCRAWYAAAKKEPCRHLTLTEAHSATTLACSPLVFHITNVFDDHSEYDPRHDGLRKSAWPSLRSLSCWPPVDELAVIGSLSEEDRSELLEAVAQGVRQEDIAFAFEALQRIKNAAANGATPSRHDQLVGLLHGSPGCFPLSLTALDILMDERFDRNMQQWVLNLVQFNVILTRFNIALPPPHSPPIDLSMLRCLTQLRHLYLNQIVLGEGHLQVLRQLATLELLSASGMDWGPRQLKALCHPPHKLQRLNTLATRYPELTEAHCVELMNLPALSSMSFASLHPSAVGMLSRFPALRVLDFCSGADLSPASALDSLSACTGLTELTLHTTLEGTPDDHGRLLEALASLRKLTLSRLAVTDLAFLEPPLSSSAAAAVASSRHSVPLPLLESLTLRGCKSLPTVQLCHVTSATSLPSLTSLTILDSFTQPLEGFTRRILTPPSRLMPNLKTFVCEDHRPMPA